MTTAECIRQRVSCRRFQEKPIPREDIRRVVDLARFSPSWKNTQPVRYVVVDDPVLKERIARECIPGQGFNTKTINRAAALAVVTYIPGLSGQGDAPLTEVQAAGWEMFDAGIAAQTFCLAARELDIGTCILGIFDADAAGRLLELEGQRAACLIAMGYPEQWKNGPGRKETEELALFYAIPRRDTNETAHRLLDQFGSLDRVLSAPEQELEKVEGVGQGAAVLLRLMGSIGDRAQRPGREEKIVASVDQAGAYFLRLLDGQRTERLYQLCVDAKGKVLSCRMLSQGQADMTVLSLRQVVENALLSGASGVFLGHNHPSGVALPSPADMEATTQVRDALKRLDIRLIDHIIVADGDYVSMASSGLLR